MPGCSLERDVVGSKARYRIAGKFEGACAWDLASRIEGEPLHELVLDFSRCGEFVDFGVAVLVNALLSSPGKHVSLTGLRQHQLRLFKYFGIDADESRRVDEPAALPVEALPPPGEARRRG